MVTVASCCVRALAISILIPISNASAVEPSPYQELATELRRRAGDGPVRLAVGNFLYQDTEMMSAFSALLRSELEGALADLPETTVVVRERLEELQQEGRFQAMMAMEPGAGTVKIGGVEQLVRGRFFLRFPRVTVAAEIVRLADGRVAKCSVTLPVASIGARIWPDGPSPTQADEMVRPQAAEASARNLAALQPLLQLGGDFDLELAVKGARRDFQQGETIAFSIRAAQACHLAVFCHQSDGTTLLLFPNAHQRDTAVRAGAWVDVPGTDKDGFRIRIAPPFGTDVVQAIACTTRSGLHEKLGELARQGRSYTVLTRGMLVQAARGSGEGKWAEAHVSVSTYPKY